MCLFNIVKINEKYQSHRVDYLSKKKVSFGHISYNEKTCTYYDRYNLRRFVATPIIGYKLLDCDNTSYYFNESSKFQLNEVYTSSRDYIEAHSGGYYPSGFHIFWSIKDARAYYVNCNLKVLTNLYLVYGYKPITYGIDSGSTQVVVCKQIEFIKKIGIFNTDKRTGKATLELAKDD